MISKIEKTGQIYYQGGHFKSVIPKVVQVDPQESIGGLTGVYVGVNVRKL